MAITAAPLAVAGTMPSPAKMLVFESEALCCDKILIRMKPIIDPTTHMISVHCGRINDEWPSKKDDCIVSILSGEKERNDHN